MRIQRDRTLDIQTFQEGLCFSKERYFVQCFHRVWSTREIS
jgi:hypothetical protein